MAHQFDHIPEGFHTVNVSLPVKGAEEAIQWYNTVLGAEEVFRLTMPGGTIVHAEIRIGNTILMMSEEDPQYNTSPATLGATTVILQLYLPNVDEVFEKALEHGAKEVIPLKDQFYGDRSGRIQDPFGHQWILATRVREVSPEEMQQMMNEME